MLVSQDLDCTSTLYIQFSFKFITKGKCLDNFTMSIMDITYLLLCLFECVVCCCALRHPRTFSLRLAAVFCEWRYYLATLS